MGQKYRIFALVALQCLLVSAKPLNFAAGLSHAAENARSSGQGEQTENKIAFHPSQLLKGMDEEKKARKQEKKTITADSIEEAVDVYFSTHAHSMYTKKEIEFIRQHDTKINDRYGSEYENAKSDEERKLIVGGVEARPGMFRYIVALIYGGSTKYQFCGGSLIKDDTVLTAAHCVSEDDGQQYFAAIGRFKLTNLTEPGEIIPIADKFLHPEVGNVKNTMLLNMNALAHTPALLRVHKLPHTHTRARTLAHSHARAYVHWRIHAFI